MGEFITPTELLQTALKEAKLVHTTMAKESVRQLAGAVIGVQFDSWGNLTGIEGKTLERFRTLAATDEIETQVEELSERVNAELKKMLQGQTAKKLATEVLKEIQWKIKAELKKQAEEYIVEQTRPLLQAALDEELKAWEAAAKLKADKSDIQIF